MDQVIFLFLALTFIALIVVIFLIMRLRKTNGSGISEASQASLSTELDLLKKSYAELENNWRLSQQKIIEKEEDNRRLENQYTRSVAELENAYSNARNEKETLASLKVKLEENAVLIDRLKDEKSKLDAQHKAQEERIESQKKEVETIQKRFTEQFEVLANNILEEKSKKFTELNREKLDQLLNPLSENIKEFQKVVRESYITEGKERHSLGEEVKKLMDLNKAISQETKDLTEALKGSSKHQGDWGETILENILEQSGMTKGREYFTQESLRDESGKIIKNEDGKVMRPDVIVQYPDKRKVIIDSKVSLTAYVEFSSANNSDEQERALKKHLISINKHIDELNSKSYSDYGSELDFVMMFIPIEGAYIAAMQGNPNLWNEAYKKNVLLISPTNLIAALRIIVDMWDRDRQSKNAEEIAERGGKLYEKFVGFLQSMEDLGSALKKSQNSYEKAVSQLSEGRGNLVNQAQQLEGLGIKYNKSKQIPVAFNKEINLIEENKEDA
jgi:DNA recombination protein RmuC